MTRLVQKAITGRTACLNVTVLAVPVTQRQARVSVRQENVARIVNKTVRKEGGASAVRMPVAVLTLTAVTP